MHTCIHTHMHACMHHRTANAPQTTPLSFPIHLMHQGVPYTLSNIKSGNIFGNMLPDGNVTGFVTGFAGPYTFSHIFAKKSGNIIFLSDYVVVI